MRSEVYNLDCMAGMAEMPDKAFDLAIVDPPYGIGADNKNSVQKLQSRQSAALSVDYGSQRWALNTPNQEYFAELKRVSRNQIIWGANYYGLSGGMIYWNKNVTMPSYSDGGLAYCSLINSLKSVTITWHGMIQENMLNKERRIHPTQKPVALYRWLLTNYAKPGDSILDTHLGSGSSRIAAYDLGFDFVGYELDSDYFNAQEERFARHIAQPKLFEPVPVVLEQGSLI